MKHTETETIERLRRALREEKRRCVDLFNIAAKATADMKEERQKRFTAEALLSSMVEQNWRAQSALTPSDPSQLPHGES